MTAHPTRIGFAAALSGLLATAWAQTPAAPAAAAAPLPAPDAAAAVMAQRNQYAEALGAEAAKAQERLQGVNAQLQSLDQDIEARVDRIVKLLSTVKDSTDSRGRVRSSKEKALQGLRNSIAYYVRERDRRNQERAAPGTDLSKAGLAEDVQALNARIERRVDQILTLANSLTQHEEFNRYERYRNDEYDYNAETKEFKRFEKDVSASAKTKAELIDDLQAGIDKQTREINALRQTLTLTTDEARQARIREEIAEKEEIVAARREQAEELLTAPDPRTKPVSSKGAFEIDKLLAEMTLELQRDFRKMQMLVAERNDYQARARFSQERLERFQKSLAAPAGTAAPTTTPAP